MRGYPQFSFWIQIALAKISLFPHDHKLCKNTSVLGGADPKISVAARINPPYGKRWRLYILPQYLANLTQPIDTESHIFW